jgi:hypothetical protein
MHAIIEELVNEMTPLANEKNLFLGFNCLLKDIILLSDYHRIKQILKNLLSNAIKFTSKGSVNLFLEENANDITIKVIDEGIGIARDKLNHIFERFKQADGSTTRKYGGTGLGLAISKELAILLGGDIKAFSILEKGSSFELILPKKTNIQNISDDKVTISSREDMTVIEDIVFFDMDEVNVEEPIIINKDKELLIINSDPAFFFPLAVSLKKDNMKLDYSKSIEDSYEKLDKSYDLVLLDDKDLSNEVEDFISYCFDKNINVLILSFRLIEDNDKYINKSLTKQDLLNHILNNLDK